MTIRSTDYLLSRFEIGDLPTATDFADLIQSLGPNGKIVDTVAALRAQPAPVLDPTADLPGVMAFTLGAVSASDEGGRSWLWRPLSVAPDDGIGVVCPSGHTIAGRWHAVQVGDTIHPEWFGLLTQDNAAFAINDALLYAWRHGYPRVAFKRTRHGIRVWGVIPVSDVTLDWGLTVYKPYVPAVPEQDTAYHALTIVGSGVEIRVPTAMVDRYNLRGWNSVNLMLDDPTWYNDHRYLHPSTTLYNGNYFVEFEAGQVFDPRGDTVRTAVASTLAPGDRVWLFRPYYPDAINQAMAAPGIVADVDGQTVRFRDPINKAFARHHCSNYTTPQTVWGGIALCPPNFMVENFRCINYEVDCSEVDAAVHCVQVWHAKPGLNCETRNFKVYGGEYSFAFFFKGRGNLIADGSIHGRGTCIANEQGNTLNRIERVTVGLKDWLTEYPGNYSAPLHFGERMSLQMEEVEFLCPEFDANAPDNNGAQLTTGTIGNRILNCRFHNVNNSYFRLSQIDGYGQLEARGNVRTGTAPGPIIDLGLHDPTGDGSTESKQPALILEDNTIECVSPDPAFGLTALREGYFCASTQARIRNNRVRLLDFTTGEQIRFAQLAGIWALQYPGTVNGEIGQTTLQHVNALCEFEGNTNLPELRWRRFTLRDIVTAATVDAANNRITLPAGADTVFSIFIDEPDLQCAGLLARLTLSDASGAGGNAPFSGRIHVATTATPDAPTLVTSKPAQTTLAVAATTDRQDVVLPVVNNAATGYVPVAAWELKAVGSSVDWTAGNLYLHHIDVLLYGGR